MEGLALIFKPMLLVLQLWYEENTAALSLAILGLISFIFVIWLINKERKSRKADCNELRAEVQSLHDTSIAHTEKLKIHGEHFDVNDRNIDRANDSAQYSAKIAIRALEKSTEAKTSINTIIKVAKKN